MTFAVIEINDSGLRLSETGQATYVSSGYAHLAGSKMLFGAAAEARSKLEPFQTTNQFWQHLSNKQLSGLSVKKTSAEIAWMHLADLWSQTSRGTQEVVFVTPANFTPNHLSVLLGISGHCPFQPVAVVDSAIAALAGAQNLISSWADKDCFCLDIQLHQTLITQLKLKSDQCQRGHFISLPVGLVHLKDALIKNISKQFIEETRFDPLRQANTEQQLYNNLSLWLNNRHLNSSDKYLNLTLGQQEYSLTLATDRINSYLAEDMKSYTNDLKQNLGDNACLLVTRRFAPWRYLLPNQPEQSIHYLTQEAVELGVPLMADAIYSHEGGVPMVTHFARSSYLDHPSSLSQEAHNRPPQPNKERHPPTHILIKNEAFPLTGTVKLALSDQGLLCADSGTLVASLLCREDQVLLTQPAEALTLNDTAARSNQILAAGDTLMIQNYQAKCIRVFS